MPRADTADPIVAYDELRRPIFGYNEEGTPICYSRIAGVPHRRCGNKKRLENGRCRKHGGLSRKGAEAPSFKTGVFSKYLNGGALDTMLAAVNDPDYLDMKSEIALNLVGLEKIVKRLQTGTDADTFNSIEYKAKELEELLFSEAFSSMKQKLGEFASNKKDVALISKFELLSEELSSLILRTRDEDKIFKELDNALKNRTRLIEAETKRTQFVQNHMPAEQVIALFRLVVEKVRKCFGNDPVGLMSFIREIDGMTGSLPTANVALKGRTGAGGIIFPKSELGDSIRNEVASSNAEFTDLADEDDEEIVVEDPTQATTALERFAQEIVYEESTYQEALDLAINFNTNKTKFGSKTPKKVEEEPEVKIEETAPVPSIQKIRLRFKKA